ncbi:toll/interleukin-1 receptor domain-containing protein [Glaciecola sp. 1036]|uniref:toll/interleukin-1 receptor domain-containing protein n=1 Tax=Alteromonadaceae TaxID=72275 RepID=UPI003CFFB46A
MSPVNESPQIFDVFISHASENRKEAIALCQYLENQGLSCWIAPRNVRVGRDYSEEIIEGVINSKSLILLLSEHVESSNFVKREVERATSYRRKVFTIRLQDVQVPKSIELFLGLPHWVDQWSSDYPERLKGIVAEITNTQVSSAQIKGPSAATRLLRFSTKNAIGLVSAIILVSFAIYFFSQRQAMPPPPEIVTRYSQIERKDFSVSVNQSFANGPIIITVKANLLTFSPSPELMQEQVRFKYSLDNGHNGEEISNLALVQIKVPASSSPASNLRLTIEDLGRQKQTETLEFNLPQLKEMMESSNSEAQAKAQQLLEKGLKCTSSISNVPAFPICYFGGIGQEKQLSELQTSIQKITFGSSPEKMSDWVSLSPLSTQGQVSAIIDRRQKFSIMIPITNSNTYYQVHFTNDETGNIHLLPQKNSTLRAVQLNSDDPKAPALFLANDFSQQNKLLVPLIASDTQKVSWSIYAGVNRKMQNSQGWFFATNIKPSELRSIKQITLNVTGKNGQSKSFQYQLDLSVIEQQASLTKYKKLHDRIVTCGVNGCYFTQFEGVASKGIIKDVLIGLDANNMLSIHEDFTSFQNTMEERRQKVLAKERANNTEESESSLSFGTPVRISGPTLVERLSEPSAIKVNKNWQNKSTTEILRYSWPVGPIFVQLVWLDGTRSEIIVFQIPLK